MPRGMYVQGDVCPGGCMPRGFVCVSRGGVCPGGSTPPWTEFLTHGCENITFPPLLLRTVMKYILAVIVDQKVSFVLI